MQAGQGIKWNLRIIFLREGWYSENVNNIFRSL